MRESVWYAMHVFSGYEQKIERKVRSLMESNPLLFEGENLHFCDFCCDVKVPFKTIVENRDGKQKERKRKLLPGYILVDLDFAKIDASAADDKKREERRKEMIGYFKRIDGVTGFLNATTLYNYEVNPAPISKQEITRIMIECGEMKDERPVHVYHDFKPGEEVRIIDGPFEDFNGRIEEVMPQQGKVKVMVEIFGRLTPVEVEEKFVDRK